MDNQEAKRLYLMTGKGGVGKTTLSLSFALYLQEKGYDVRYTSFHWSSLKESRNQSEDLKKFQKEKNLKIDRFELEEALIEYISDKFNSKTIARFIVMAPFFRSLIDIIPGFSYVIFVGKLVKELQLNPNRVYIIDGPASGHGLTLIDTLYKFRDIFASGLLYQDCKKLIHFVEDPKNFQINIISLPSSIVIQETLDTLEAFESIGNFSKKIILNQSMEATDFQKESEFLQKYLSREKESRSQVASLDPFTVPFKNANEFLDTVKALAALNLKELQ